MIWRVRVELPESREVAVYEVNDASTDYDMREFRHLQFDRHADKLYLDVTPKRGPTDVSIIAEGEPDGISKEIDQTLTQEEYVYVHCRDGRGGPEIRLGVDDWNADPIKGMP